MQPPKIVALQDLSLEDLFSLLVDADDVPQVTKLPLAAWSRPGFSGAAALLDLKPATQLRIGAAFELSRRRDREVPPPQVPLTRPKLAFEILSPLFAADAVEVFRVLLLDARHRLLVPVEIARGTLTWSIIHPREVFRPALLALAAGVIAAHNHPSGDPEPSREDLHITRVLANSGHLLGIPFLDHLVLGDGRFTSLRERSPQLFVFSSSELETESVSDDF